MKKESTSWYDFALTNKFGSNNVTPKVTFEKLISKGFTQHT